MGYCKKCGKEISSDSLFCENCGEKIVNNIQFDQMYKKKKKRMIPVFLLGIVIILGIIFFIINSYTSGFHLHDLSKVSSTTSQENEINSKAEDSAQSEDITMSTSSNMTDSDSNLIDEKQPDENGFQNAVVNVQYLFENGKYGEAFNYFDQAYQINPKNEEVNAMRSYSEELSIAWMAINTETSDTSYITLYENLLNQSNTITDESIRQAYEEAATAIMDTSSYQIEERAFNRYSKSYENAQNNE